VKATFCHPFGGPRITLELLGDKLRASTEADVVEIRWDCVERVELFRAPFWVRWWSCAISPSKPPIVATVIAATLRWRDGEGLERLVTFSSHGLGALTLDSGLAPPSDPYARFQVLIDHLGHHLDATRIHERPFIASVPREQSTRIP